MNPRKQKRKLHKVKDEKVLNSFNLTDENCSHNVDFLLDELFNLDSSDQERLVLKNKSDIEEILKQLKKEIEYISKGININVAIPILLIVLDKLYFNSEYKELKRLGIELKNCISILLLYGDKNILIKSSKLDHSFISLLERLILFEYIRTFQWLFSVDKTTPFFEISVSMRGVSFSKDGEKVFSEIFLIPGRLYGDAQRSVSTNNMLLFDNFSSYYKSLDQVIDGIEPKFIDAFRGTYFEYFKGINDKRYTKFWLGLKLRLELFVLFVIEQNNKGISKNIVFFKLNELQKIISKNFQNDDIEEGILIDRSFLDKEYLQNFNKIVSRPLIPLFDGNLLVASISNMIDSINIYIESFIFKMDTTETISEKDEVLFKEIYSKPFETEVIDLLKNSGYKSGEVTDKGAWRGYYDTREFVEEIANDTFIKENTGEIDCLAISEEKKIIYVIECKVLQFPTDYSSYRNRVSHIHGKYRTQLQKKANFVKSKFEGYVIRPILLLDKDITILRQYERNLDNLRILTFESLQYELKS
ncbi:V-type ATPase subunit [Streptococcus salivarius]|nr:V-type ATPase subunit [Streptococcus salivarius]MBZ5836590.1 hypothetical protein [Streptococcus salivarius]